MSQNAGEYSQLPPSPLTRTEKRILAQGVGRPDLRRRIERKAAAYAAYVAAHPAATPAAFPSGPVLVRRYTGDAYHGSGRKNIAFLSADPAFRHRDHSTPASRLGAFFSAGPEGAREFRPDGGALYRATLDLKNAVDVSWDDYLWVDGEATADEVDAIRRQLMTEGHDGIVFLGENGNPMDLVSFRDVPVQLHERAVQVGGAFDYVPAS